MGGRGRGKWYAFVRTQADTDLPGISTEMLASLWAAVCVACIPICCGTATAAQLSCPHSVQERALLVMNKCIGIYGYIRERAGFMREHYIASVIFS